MENQYWYDEQKQPHPADNKKQRTGKVSVAALIVCMLITALVGGAVGGYLVQGPAAVKAPAAISSAATPAAQTSTAAATAKPSTALVTQVASDGTYTKAQIIALAAPSIVGIDVSGTGTDALGRTAQTQGSASGIIVTTDGYIITNNHVVDGAKTIKVYLQNNDTPYEAKLIGTDSRSDLAVIKIDAQNLTPVTMGDSDKLVVGEDVIAIGNPLGELKGTATSGMVSALSRDITIDGQEMTLLQTDAAINPGNSGGGLFNAQGQLIGVVNAKIASSETEGLGFAIPINTAKTVISDLMDKGYVTGRAYLGVYTQNVAVQSGSVDGNNGNNGNGNNNDFFNMFGIGQDQGNVETRVQVAQVVTGSAAEKAGIKTGDLIVKVNDTKITNGSELAKAIGAYKPGDTAKITIERDSKEQELTVTFQEYVPADSSNKS